MENDQTPQPAPSKKPRYLLAVLVVLIATAVIAVLLYRPSQPPSSTPDFNPGGEPLPPSTEAEALNELSESARTHSESPSTLNAEITGPTDE